MPVAPMMPDVVPVLQVKNATPTKELKEKKSLETLLMKRFSSVAEAEEEEVGADESFEVKLTQ